MLNIEILNSKDTKKNTMDKKNNMGQYFTTNKLLKEKVYEFILNEPKEILEPSMGQGDLVKQVLSKKNVKFDLYEIDNSITMLDKFNVKFCDFLKEKIDKKYITIIGNPPYVRTKTGNLYIDFIDKCYELLENNGELIFIIPSDFFKLTCATKVIEKMISNGTFTHVFHPHNENLFENATIDIIIFRYCKNPLLDNKVIYNNDILFLQNNQNMITFVKEMNNTNCIIFEDIFDIFVGIVSGKDSIYKNEILGNISVLIDQNKFEKFIFITEFPSNNNSIDNYLLENKNLLLERKIRKFTEKNWFEWGAPRNIKVIEKNMGKKCIYVFNLTRKKQIAFIGTVNYFSGNLLLLLPKKEIDLQRIINYLNSENFKQNFIFSGRFKIGHRQLCKSNLTVDLV